MPHAQRRTEVFGFVMIIAVAPTAEEGPPSQKPQPEANRRFADRLSFAEDLRCHQFQSMPAIPDARLMNP
jgi:hypothetical protein